MPATNLIVFRDHKKQVPAKTFAGTLERAVEGIHISDTASALDALVLAGQLESALQDSDWPVAPASSLLTDALAEYSLGVASLEEIHSRLHKILGYLPDLLSVSEPEGFSYYALHPLDFADIIESISVTSYVAIIGIRSIGTTLSAVAMAKLRGNHTPASRISVRPNGHPYDRKTSFNSSQIEWIDRHRSRNATFLLLDEGPGLSGSSFLSVAEALVQQSVAPDRIKMIGTRNCDPSQLCAVGARKRWEKFSWHRVNSRIGRRFSDHIPLSGGAWRGVFVEASEGWPASWREMESLRFLASDRRHIFKFEGLGGMGKAATDRAEAICKAGFGPAVTRIGEGMNAYAFIQGRPLSASDMSSGLLERLARYCAYRATEFVISGDRGSQLQEMVEFNLQQETGVQLSLPDGCLQSRVSIITDGKMQPHKWVASVLGDVFKIDGVRHGDDHFLPGPADIAWDLAGAIVEWNMTDATAQYLLERFRSHCGSSTPEHLHYFVLAYIVFRLAYCRMALAATGESEEKLRFHKACRFYSDKLNAMSRVASQPEKK